MKRLFVMPTIVFTAAAAVLTGCSSAGDGHSAHHSGSPSASIAAGAPARGPHNDADVAFARDMIPHHRQAVEMADLASSATSNASVLALARQIEAAQAPEIATMSGWLEGWDQPVPTGSEHDMGGMQHSGHTMPGMMTSQDMAELGRATGSAFDTKFLTMMIEHHRGALSMARTELAQGRNADAKRLARSIVATQTAEIARMTKLSMAD